MKTAIKKFAIDLRIRVGYGTAFFLLLSSYLLTLYANSELLREARLVDHGNKIILNAMTSRYQTLNNIILMSLGLAVLMALFGFYTYSRENKARRLADQRVAEYQQQLQERIEQLGLANKELIRMRSIEKFAATGRIARTIAHEVRNPLTNINLAVEQLQSELNGQENGQKPVEPDRQKPEAAEPARPKPESAELMLEMISRNSIRINLLITDLLNSTKFTDLVYKRISINQLLDETLELAKDRIQLNNITVMKRYSGEICDIAVDVERIKIAFLNIVVNAIEAMEPGKGILQLHTMAKEDKCVVTITDNGPGIDEESLSKVFEPYFTSKPKGTGLGLTNTQNIILNHNGHIGFESKKGTGTTFTIQLDFA
jgi:signal transduction histidine kinase